jgi:cellulose synthase/poly-beta-1,6-N-acetylglucosamine synthase-like glycosyltransferase
LAALLLVFAALLLVPVSVLLVQVVAALPAHRPRALPEARRAPLAVLVPAHNEAGGIAHALRSIASQLAAGDRIVVVADNCSDDTAAIAARAGASVIARHDRDRRGKPYALDFGIRHLERNPPEVVVIVDADCTLEPGALERLARLCVEAGRPVQALYLMRGPRARLAEFAWRVNNQVRAFGSLRLGWPCLLTGSGMAFPWSIIRDAQLASGHLAEDLQLTVDLVRAGACPVFCPEACVTSEFASGDGLRAQRTRWEHGHLALLLSEVPGLLLQALARREPKLAALALDLGVPPLALLSLAALALCAALPLSALLGLPAALLGAAVLLAWSRYARDIPLASLACAPLYALEKLPLYSRFLVKRQVEWVRSRREGE